MIHIKNLVKRFEDKLIFDNFSLELRDGLIYCLMGPSGCGKTTLLRLLSRLDRPDSGEISGLDIKRPSFVFQEDRLIETSTVIENINFVLKPGDSPAALWLDAVGLGKEAGSLPAELSGGMRRKAALARAIAHGGDAFFLDEPFTGIDREARLELIPVLRQAISSKTAFIVTHDEADASLLGDIIIRLSHPPQTTAEPIKTSNMRPEGI